MTTRASSDHPDTPGGRFRRAVDEERPLAVVGVVNAFCARLADGAAFRALYLSGAGVANASYGLPDLGMTSLPEVLEDVHRILAVTERPLLVDCDTGWGGALNVARTVREMARAGVAAIHLEDQVEAKRCGHRPGKQLVSAEEMTDRVKAAVDARPDETFVIMARTDARAVEGLSGAIVRANRYVEAGADIIFAEALTSRDEYRTFTESVPVPVLANMTEFGRSPLLSIDELRACGVRLVLYPLTAFRAMNAAATKVYEELRAAGTQRDLLPSLQTREELYRVLDYHAYERRLDQSDPTPPSSESTEPK
jgi:methylisocitrate lyase